MVPTEDARTHPPLINFNNTEFTGCFAFNITANIDSCSNANPTAGIHCLASIADVMLDKYNQLCNVEVHLRTVS